MDTIQSIQNQCPFPIGQENREYAQYFIGMSYLQSLSSEQMNIANVTFEPGCRNNWHIHHGGGQILLCTAGNGYYQAWGEEIRELHAGDVVNITPGTKHWHGATAHSWFSHIAISVPSEHGYCEWLEKVIDDYPNI